MMPLRARAALACVTLLLASSAYADIGQVGGLGAVTTIGGPDTATDAPPATPRAGPAAPQVTAPAAVAKPVDTDMLQTQKPLLVIRFNQKHVYFEDSLKRAVQAAQRRKPAASYQVVSFMPSGSGGRPVNGQMAALARANLSAVTGAMNKLGVPASNIATSTQPLENGGNNQEVRVYVQ